MKHLKEQLKKLHRRQWKLKQDIRSTQRAIGNKWKNYEADCKHNEIIHPKLNLPMVLQMSVPKDIGQMTTRISKLNREAKANAKTITGLQYMVHHDGQVPLKDHIARHKELHNCLDELMADFMSMTGKFLSRTNVMELAEWAHGQTLNPSTEHVSVVESMGNFQPDKEFIIRCPKIDENTHDKCRYLNGKTVTLKGYSHGPLLPPHVLGKDECKCFLEQAKS